MYIYICMPTPFESGHALHNQRLRFSGHYIIFINKKIMNIHSYCLYVHMRNSMVTHVTFFRYCAHS